MYFSMYVCMYVRMQVCMYACMYITPDAVFRGPGLPFMDLIAGCNVEQRR